jgi:hypothetical protein
MIHWYSHRDRPCRQWCRTPLLECRSPDRPPQGFDDRGFGGFVDLGDEIVGLLGRDLEQVEVVGCAIDDLAGATRRLDGDIQGWMHGLKELTGGQSHPN